MTKCFIISARLLMTQTMPFATWQISTPPTNVARPSIGLCATSTKAAMRTLGAAAACLTALLTAPTSLYTSNF